MPYFTTRFNSRDYDAHVQNWAVAQAPDGSMWVGNTEGLLRYDGVHWHHLALTGGTTETVRSLTVGPGGRLYVGGVGTFGYVGVDSIGTPRYVQLAGPELLGDADVWATVAAGGDVFFQTFGHVYRYDGRRVQVAAVAGEGRRFHKAFGVERPGHTELYVREEGVGLLRYDGGRRAFVPVPGGAAYAITKVFALLPGRAGELLVGTADYLEVLAGGVVRPLPSPVLEEALRAHRIYDAVSLGGGHYALGTLGAGIYVIDRNGRILAHLGQEVQLTEDDLVLDLALDTSGGLWAALSNGVARFDVLPPLTVFDERLGLPGRVYQVIRHRGTVYASTEVGVFQLVPQGRGEPARFEPTGLREQAWSLNSDGDQLLVATSSGLFELVEGQAQRLILEGAVFVIRRTQRAGTLLVGTGGGLAVLRKGEGGWEQEGALIDIGGDVWSIVEQDGVVWVGGPSTGIVAFRADLAGGLHEVARYDRRNTFVQTIGGAVIVTPQTVFRPTSGGTLVPDPALTRFVQELDSSRYSYMGEDMRGHLWIGQGEEVRAYAQRSTGAWADITPPVLRTLRDGFLSVTREGDVLWIGTERGVLRFDGRADGVERYAMPPRASFTGVTASDGRPLWVGGLPNLDAAPELRVRSAAGPVRIEFAAAVFNHPQATRYRTRLRGFDEAWSSPSPEPWREYTNLPPGEYLFEVVAENAHGVRSEPAVLTLVVEPRWDQTWWARGLFALALLALIGLVTASRIRVHREAAAAERRRADEFARLNRRLEDADRLKDEFLANASHELRTPLTAVLGYADLLAEYDGAEPPEEVRALAGHIRDGGHRLLHTVEDIMDVAALRAGRASLEQRPVDLAEVARAVAAEFRPRAEAKGLPLLVLPDGVAGPVTGDPAALTRMLRHLLSNAVKFTDAGSVRVLVDPRGGPDGAAVEVSVADTGRGISAEFLPRLFDEFAQESTGIARQFEGNGLGLSVVKRLAESMGGTVRAESEEGRGTTVRLRFPRAPEPVAALPVEPDRPEVSGDGWVVTSGDGAEGEEPFAALTFDRR